MKKLVFLFALMIITAQLFAQTKKVYLTHSGKFTSNSGKATGYLLVQKLTNGDGYLASEYDIHNNLLSKGTYEDETLNTPSGKFTYYTNSEQANGVFSNASYKADNSYHLSSSGYYVNGKREGLWTEYAADGAKVTECNFENNVLNGSYKVFSGSYEGVGSAVNGNINGKFDWYTNGLLATELQYENGKLKSKTEYLKPARERTSLKFYLERKLRCDYVEQLYDSKLTLKYTVDVDGKIKNVQFVKGFSPEVNNAILAALADYRTLIPAKYNGKAIEQDYTQTFYLFNTQPYYNPYAPHPSYASFNEGNPSLPLPNRQ